MDSKGTTMVKAQKLSKYIVKIVNVTPVVRSQFYEAKRVLFVHKENKENREL